MNRTQKKKLTLFSLLGVSTLAITLSVAFAANGGMLKPLSASDCKHESVEHYIGHSNTETGAGYVEHWACCECHNAWADETRHIDLGNTGTDRSKIDIDVGFKPEWGARSMLAPTYDSINDRVLYTDSNFYISSDAGSYGFIETKSQKEIEGFESIKFHILNNTSSDILNIQFIKGVTTEDWVDIGLGVISFEKGVSKSVEFNADQWNYRISDKSSGPCFIIKDPETNEVSGSFSVSVELISRKSEIDSVIAAIDELPSTDSYTMPANAYVLNNLERVEALYNNLADNLKPFVTNYDKLEANLAKCENYDVIYKMDSSKSISVIPSYVPGGYSSVTGGTATFGSAYVGDYIDVTSASDGRAALDITNFSCGGYETLYFYVKVSSSCDIYLSDGTSNDGWGHDCKNTWSMTGLWCNANEWRQIAIDVSTGIFASNWSLGFRTKDTGITFQISNIYGYRPAKTELSYYFGQRTATTETYESFGTVYNLIQEQWFIDNPGPDSPGTMASAGKGVLSSALPEGYAKMLFAIYNPNTSASNFHIAGGAPWADGPFTTLAPQTWTVVEIVEKDFSINDTGTIYFYIDNANVSGWKITAIFAGK